MTDCLVIGDRVYSSWSLRAWLLWAAFDTPVEVQLAPMYTAAFSAGLAPFAPARLVPAARIGAALVWDSLAIAETLAETRPEIWPDDPALRAGARALAAEMHSGFEALRGACPMNLRGALSGFEASDAVLADLDRLETLWRWAWRHDVPGIWLFGRYSVADAFFAPVAARIAGYDLPVSAPAQRYVAQHLAHPAFRRWRAMGLADGVAHARYEMDLPSRPWPGPTPIAAEPVRDLSPVNKTCPYSGKPVADDSLARIRGSVIGFCNPWCRDKTVADAEAWPKAIALLQRPAP
ncbi:MAG: glutathione S-transferase [Pseudomonadota bacterium]